MLGLSFSPRREHWAIDVRILDYTIQGDLKSWFFVTSMLCYFPVIFLSILLLIVDTTKLINSRNPKVIISITIFSLLPFISLYRFSDWVMSTIL